MVPNSWEKVSLGEVFDFRNGINADKSQYGQGVKFVNVMDVFGNDVLTEPKIIGRISISEKKLDDNRLEYGDVLFNRTSETFDEIAMSAVYLDSADATFGGFVIRGRPLTNSLDPKYTIYAFQDSNFRKQVIQLGQGAVRANIGQKDLVKVELLVPPLPEQQKIAKILTTWDKAIDSTEHLIDNSKQQKKALMQQLLTGKKRLLDDEGKRFEGEWKSSNFSKVFEVANNKNSQVKSSDYLESGTIPIVDQGKKLVSGYTNKQDIYSDTPVIIFGDHTRVVKWVDFNFCQGADGTQVLRPNSILETKFAYYLLSHTPIPNLGYSRHMRELKEKSFKYPIDKLEQQKIATVLTNADKEIDLLEQQLADLQQEKKALMQVLLTGKKRVVVDG